VQKKRRKEKMEEEEAIGDILSSSETKPQGARQFGGGEKVSSLGSKIP
jgi:hypothetical protein